MKEILILDDDHDSADLLADVLGMYLPEKRFRVVYSGEDALKAIDDGLPDLAILDLEMPGLGGEMAGRAIRERAAGASVILMALSGNSKRLMELQKEGPFDHLLTKPLNLKAAIELIHSHLG